ncbi:hypothetical protein [Corynebacterium oculi]|uniref:Uncharacterized protein n=1 Tax=Corynebacterium oculi TaxID=1544416 RepID=A0A0N8VZP5_9CORY|nr:hypothetical protein [Corynebacterium oculi]KQB84474.1 hypothetical protein Cocul_01276 [Corynebacterium oculi]
MSISKKKTRRKIKKSLRRILERATAYGIVMAIREAVKWLWIL